MKGAQRRDRNQYLSGNQGAVQKEQRMDNTHKPSSDNFFSSIILQKEIENFKEFSENTKRKCSQNYIFKIVTFSDLNQANWVFVQ